MPKKYAEEYDPEKEIKKYIDNLRSYQSQFFKRDLEVLRRYKLILKPSNIFEYLHAIFVESGDRIIKLCALEKVLEEKTRQK